MRSFRSKPVGWRQESYRHYLAAKGVKTKYFAYATQRAAEDFVSRVFRSADVRRQRAADPKKLKEAELRTDVVKEAAIIPPTDVQYLEAVKNLKRRARAQTLLVAARENLGDRVVQMRLQEQAQVDVNELSKKDLVNALKDDEKKYLELLKTVKSKLENPNAEFAGYTPAERTLLDLLFLRRLGGHPEEVQELELAFAEML
jgi:hypothetical protein